MADLATEPRGRFVRVRDALTPRENFNINTAGFVIVGVFVLTWAAALSIWHFGHIEQKWDIAAAEVNVIE